MKEYLEKSKIRICGGCGQGIVKKSGCSKMKCRCGYKFCYTCGSKNADCEHDVGHGYASNN